MQPFNGGYGSRQMEVTKTPNINARPDMSGGLMESTLDFTRCKLPPFDHQREDTLTLLQHRWFFIASEMRTGKSAIVVMAAQFLFEANTIDRVIIISPDKVRAVWADQTLGEIQKHLWPNVPATVISYHEQVRLWMQGPTAERRLEFVVTNYEYIIDKDRVKEMADYANARTLLVLDESSFIRNHAAERTKACFTIRRKCGRVVLLNGTPIFHSPMDLFTQANILHPSILDCKYITQFKAKYAVEEPIVMHDGRPLTKVVGKGRYAKEIIIKQTTGWQNLEDLQQRLAPYTVRRLQAECLDLPPKLDPVPLTATLTPETWKKYKEMRNELVVWLGKQVSVSSTTAIKVLRLSQITSGILGGVADPRFDKLETLLLPGMEQFILPFNTPLPPPESEELAPSFHAIGREKLDVLIWFIKSRLEQDPNLHLVAWSRFRLEAERAIKEVKQHYPQFESALLMGGQNKADQKRALALLKPETSPTGPVFVSGVEGTGSFGLDMTAAHTCVTLSSGYSPGLTLQTLDRVYGPNQKFPIAYFDIMAIGPRGQRTIDHDILTARRTGENIALRTSAAWVKAITQE